MEKDRLTGEWSMVGTSPNGVVCHKPWTVSGGGKSEISKALKDQITTGAFVIQNFEKDVQQIREILQTDFSDRFKDRGVSGGRPLLSEERSLGSVVKLLTPSETEYTAEYNKWVESIPYHVKEWIYHLKANYRSDMGGQWDSRYSVEERDGVTVNHLYFDNEPVLRRYLRVGTETDGKPRLFSLRMDFEPASKNQLEDDITASITVPGKVLHQIDSTRDPAKSYKIVQDVELRHFQRPDDAKHRGIDRAAESHLAGRCNFIANFQPLTTEMAVRRMAQRTSFDKYTPPMQKRVMQASTGGENDFFAASDSHRIINEETGEVSPNPRFLEARHDLIDPFPGYVSEVSLRLARGVSKDQPLVSTVDAVLPGRRVNPPDREAGIRPLSVYAPIHYQELPEMYVDLVASLTGKSPSTTGAGSEGALTKGPFNALPAIVDLNDSLVSDILTRVSPFSTVAGYLGPKFEVGHDISMLVPEVWSRMSEEERDPKYLIDNGFLERVPNFSHDGDTVESSRLGYRITPLFVNRFCGGVFNHPHKVFSPEMLSPELQDPEAFIDGVKNIIESGAKAAQSYFEDGTIEMASPPLRALLHIMVNGEYEATTPSGKSIWTLESPEFRAQFTPEALLESEWYAERLVTQQNRDIKIWSEGLTELGAFLNTYAESLPSAERDLYMERMDQLQHLIDRAEGLEYLDSLRGSIGADPALARR
jgi:hypothetical protein